MKKMSLIFNPFNRIAGLQALLMGFVFMLLGAAFAHLGNARFDGVLDLHFVSESHFLTAFLDQLINLLCMTLCFYLAAIASGASSTRVIDIAGTMLLAKAPYTLLPLLNVTGFMFDLADEVVGDVSAPPSAEQMTQLLLASLPIILFSIWSIVLMVNAYKVSTNLKGTRMVVGFIAALLAAELLSKIIISFQFY